MRATVTTLAALTLLAACSVERPPARRLAIEIASLGLAGIGDVCFDLRVTNGPGGSGEVVWTRGTPGLNGGAPDAGAICADRFGDGAGDIAWIGTCDADGQLDADPASERLNSVTLWIDGLYDEGGAYLDPRGPSRWQDPCPGGCTLDVVCEEGADARVVFDVTVMRDGGQGFFDVAVSFDDIFCSAKLDTCYVDGAHNNLLFGADETRDWTAVFGFACTAGRAATDTTLHYGDLAVVCTAGVSEVVFPLNPVAAAGNNSVASGGHTLHYGVYRGAEALACDDPATAEVSSCHKVYWNLAVSLDDLAPLGTCTLAFAATATDGGAGFVNGRPEGAGVAYPFIEVAATLTPSTCQRHALNDGGVVRTVYRGALTSPAAVMCTAFDGEAAGPIAGADCSDSCPNDPAKTRPGLCGCGVADTDADGDLTVDCLDACAADPAKVSPGVCGCGTSELDGDGDTVADCLDGCDADPAKIDPGLCGCGTSDVDTDGDEVPDCFDDCDADPAKADPGVCGCGTSDVDTDGDAVADCFDDCDADPAKTDPGVCGCGTSDVDTDGDEVPDCTDLCDADATKIAPGLCGCGTSDVDTDSDATPDCFDDCDADPNKTEPGVCGCGTSDVDSDSDATPDCTDLCDADATKIAPGVCGCGVADNDSDDDGALDCQDACPADPLKVALGACGCGAPDTDSDGDATPNCLDGCPADPDKAAPGVCGCGVPDAPGERLGGTQANAASSCVAIYASGDRCGDGRYWVDPTGGPTSDAIEVFCDMTNGGWMKLESATWPFMFNDTTWTSQSAATPSADNYSILARRASYIDANGCYTLRLRVGESGNWLGPLAHQTVWRQCHDPFTQTTNGSDYTFLSGEAPTTCGGFNGLHHRYQSFSYTSDADSVDDVNCWWMQVVPKVQFGPPANYPGYLDGYGGAFHTHVWQSLWVKAAGLGLGREAPATSCAPLLALGYGDGTYWLDPDGGDNADAFRAYCDMAGGGWARLIGPSTTLADLNALPATSNTINNFLNDSTYGVSWGTFTTEASWGTDPHHLQLDIQYGQIKVTHSGFYNTPAGGLGVLSMYNQGSTLLYSSDSHTTGSAGQSLQVGGAVIFSGSTTNITNRTDIISAAGSTTLKIGMNAYTSAYTYTRRYIRELWFR